MLFFNDSTVCIFTIIAGTYVEIHLFWSHGSSNVNEKKARAKVLMCHTQISLTAFGQLSCTHHPTSFIFLSLFSFSKQHVFYRELHFVQQIYSAGSYTHSLVPIGSIRFPLMQNALHSFSSVHRWGRNVWTMHLIAALLSSLFWKRRTKLVSIGQASLSSIFAKYFWTCFHCIPSFFKTITISVIFIKDRKAPFREY